MNRNPGVRARSGFAVLAVMVTIGLGATPVLAATRPVVHTASRPSPQAAKQFLARLEKALRTGDVAFLLTHLDRVVIARYGKAACREFVATLEDPTRRLTPTAVTGPSAYDYTSDDLTTMVRNVFTIDVDSVQDGAPGEPIVHVKVNSWFADCGTPRPPAVAGAVVAAARRFEGHFKGTWKNLTFGSTGTSEMTLAVDAKRATIKLTSKLTGDVFGAPAPVPETLSAELDLTDIGAPVIITSKTFGRVSATLQADGSLLVDAPDVPGARVNTFRLVVVLVGSDVEGTYEVGLAGGATANGTVSLTRI
jgi:hypothetical protein